MTTESDDPRGLNKISRPAEPPKDQLPADPETAAEEWDYKRKPPTPLEREAAAHRAHYIDLKAQIDLHLTHRDKLDGECIRLRNELDQEKRRAELLAVECEGLREKLRSAGLSTTIGTIAMGGGGTLLGIGGTQPGLGDSQKSGYTWSGTALAVVGGVLLLATLINLPALKKTQAKPAN